MIHTASSTIADQTRSAPQYEGALAEDLAADCVKLQLFFQRENGFLSEYHVDRLHLVLSPKALENLKALVPGQLGRWDRGWCPGPLLALHHEEIRSSTPTHSKEAP